MALIPSRKRNIIGKPVVAQTVSTSTTAAKNGTAFTYDVVRLIADVDTFFKVGHSPVATATDHFLPASQAIEVFVEDGEEISFILASGTGTVYLSELV